MMNTPPILQGSQPYPFLQTFHELSINSHGLKVPEKCTNCWVDEEIVCFPGLQ